MTDYILSFGILLALVLGALSLWHALAGRPASRRRAMGRVAAATLVAVLVTGVGLYQFTKSRTLQLTGALVSHVETGDKVIAFTFDDGPTPDYTEYVLEVLASHDASATFYVTGGESEAHPELLAEIAAAGHEIGNHTYSHPRLYFLPASAVADEIERTDAIIRAAGYEGPITFRPPGCKRLLTTPLYLASHNRTTVTWNLEPDSIEEVAGDADAITSYVVDNASPGSIVLMHVMYAGREPSREALPEILEQLSAAGYRFVTVTELMALDGQP